MDNEERTRFLKSDSQSKSTPAASKATKSKVVKLQLDRRVGFWGYMMPAIYQLMASMHILNAAFLVVDTALNNVVRIAVA
ncbi:hypothetical protein ACLOJK_015706 [Asimina triloba]